MPVKDRDKELNPAEKRYGEGSHDDLSVHPERREAEVDDLEKLYNAESAPGGRQQSKQEGVESDKLDSGSDPDSSWENLTGTKPGRFKFNRKRAAAAGGVFGAFIGGSIGFFGFLAGPLQFIHFAQVLQDFHISDVEDFGDSRAGRLLRWASTQNSPQDRNLSRLGNKVAVHYENKLSAKGIDLEYKVGGLSSIDIDPSTPEGKRLINSIENDVGSPLPRDQTTGKKKVILAESSGEIAPRKVRRATLDEAVRAAGLNRISSSVASRMLKVRAAVNFHPLKSIAQEADKNLRLRYEEYKERRAADIQDGAQDTNTRSYASDADPDSTTDADKGTLDNLDGKTQELADLSKAPDVDFDTKVSNVKGAITGGVGFTAVAGVVCGLSALSDSVGELQESNITMPLIRTGWNAITVGNQIMTGQDVNFEELAALSESFYDQETKQSWVASEDILAEQGKEGGVPIPETAKPGKDKPGFFNAVDSIIEGLPFASNVCDVFNSTIGGFALSIVGIVASGATGPFGYGVAAASEVAQDQLASRLAPHLVRWLSGSAVDVANFAGPAYGSIANHGAFLAANNQMLGMGGRALDVSDRILLDNERMERQREEMSNQSFYARILKPTEPQSLFASTVLASPGFQSTGSMVASATSYPTNLFSNIGTSLRNLIPSARAQVAPYDYGVDEIGYTVDEKNSEQENIDNPYLNEEYVLERGLDELNSKYGEACFGATVDSAGKITYTQAPSYQQLEQNKSLCSNPDDQDLLHYRFYLADMGSMKAITCYEGLDEAACQELGFGNTSSTEGSASPNLYMLGDSLTVGMKSAGLDQKLSNKGWQPTTNGLVGRKVSGGPSPDGLTQLDQDAETVRSAGTVVVALGTNHWGENEATFRAELQKIYDKVTLLNSDASIWWVNYYGTGQFSGPLVNHSETLKSFADSTNGRIIDWAAGADPYFTGEDVHPNNYAAMADLVVNALGSPSPTGSSGSITKYSPALPSTGTSIQPKGITLHWWGSSGDDNNIEVLANTLRQRGLGVQFGITSDGTTYQMTQNETDQASHASGANSTTFGIEIEGGPDDFGANGPTDNPAKFNAVVNLVKYLSAKYNIPTEFISPGSITCGDVVGIHPHKAYNKCGGSKIDIDDAYFNAVMDRVRGG